MSDAPMRPNFQKPRGGLVHSYQKYDPKNFPSPTAEPPDLASAAFEHMLAFGNMREFSEEELANAIRLDPSMFPRLGPSIASLRAMLEERKRKILETYEVDGAKRSAEKNFADAAAEARPPKNFADAFAKAARQKQIADLEDLYYRQRDDRSEFAQDLARVINNLGELYQVEELASKYAFTGREGLTPEEALAIKEELETIDELLEQLRNAAQNAQLAIIDMDDLSQFADSEEAREQIESLNQIQQQIEDYVREQARAQGLEFSKGAYQLSPKSLRLFQKTLLHEIFTDLAAARSGRHSGPIVGEGAVELERTKPYEFGDAATHVDVAQTLINAAAAARDYGEKTAGGSRGTPRIRMDDIEIHLTRNNPKCATMVLMDMSGSMRYDGQYINCKRMALALDGLIRTEYPGDFVGFVEMASFGKVTQVADIPALLPKPVSIHQPVVRLKADMSNPSVSESRLPQHFTNIQHALQLSRQVLGAQATPNRQVMLITDGLPTAHFEGREVFFLYPPDPRTEAATMREAMLCAQLGITINIFLLPNWGQSSEDIQFAHKMAEATRGRVFFTGGKDLDRFVLWDYVRQRRKILG